MGSNTTIKNLPTTFGADQDRPGEFLSMAEVLAFVVGNVSPDKGATFTEINRRCRVVELLENSGDDIELTPKQLRTVREAFLAHRWPSVNRDVIDIGRALGLKIDDDDD